MAEPGKSPTVFVVDDDHLVASTMTIILQHEGYDARFFVSPLKALEAARTVLPDLAIVDVMMPELSGIDLAVRLREECPACKVLLFSGRTETADLLDDARLRGHEFPVVAKPIHPTRLLAMIKDEI
jgi:DNA-binding response OmpR family regulator